MEKNDILSICQAALKDTPQDDEVLRLDKYYDGRLRVVYNNIENGRGTVFPSTQYPTASGIGTGFVPPLSYFLVADDVELQVLQNAARDLRGHTKRNDYVVLQDQRNNRYFLMVPIETLLEADKTHQGLQKAREARDKAIRDIKFTKDSNELLDTQVPLLAVAFSRSGFSTFDGQCNPQKAFNTYLKKICEGAEYSIGDGSLYSVKSNVKIDLPKTPSDYYEFLVKLGVIQPESGMGRKNLEQYGHNIKMPDKKGAPFLLSHNKELGAFYENTTGALSIFHDFHSDLREDKGNLKINTFITLPLRDIIVALQGPAAKKSISNSTDYDNALLQEVRSMVGVMKDPEMKKKVIDALPERVKAENSKVLEELLRSQSPQRQRSNSK